MKALVLSAERRGGAGLADPTQAPASTVWAHPTLVEADVPEPSLVAAHDVVVRVAFCGICGSDLHCSEAGPDGYVAFGGPARLPVVLGHEVTGVVVRTGPAVRNVGEGDLVAAESVWACWNCDECRAGHLNECRRVELVGLTVDGALAPLVRLDARHCHRLDPLVRRLGRERALELGALLEPLGVASRALTRAGVTAGDRLVVVGTGPIGLGAIMLARAAGVRDVIAFDLIPERVDLAASAGARAFDAAALHAAGTPVEDIVHEAFGEQGASVAIEAAGTAAAFASSFAALGPRGRLVVLGRMPAPVALDTNALLTKALTVIGSRGHAGGGIFPTLIERMAARHFDPAPLVTAVFDHGTFADAFAHARRGGGAKTLVRLANGV